MADTNKNDSNETMQNEQAKASVAGDRKPEQANFDKNRPEQGREKSAIGGGEQQNRSQTGEPGRARSELDQKSDSGTNRESDNSRSEPTSR